MSITETLQKIRTDIESGKYKRPWRGVQLNLGTAYWPTHPSASNHFTLAGTKWNSDMHPKD